MNISEIKNIAQRKELNELLDSNLFSLYDKVNSSIYKLQNYIRQNPEIASYFKECLKINNDYSSKLSKMLKSIYELQNKGK